MAETWNKKEREKRKKAIKREKTEKRLERKENLRNGNLPPDNMIAYLDEDGNIVDTPPESSDKMRLSQK